MGDMCDRVATTSIVEELKSFTDTSSSSGWK